MGGDFSMGLSSLTQCVLANFLTKTSSRTCANRHRADILLKLLHPRVAGLSQNSFTVLYFTFLDSLVHPRRRGRGSNCERPLLCVSIFFTLLYGFAQARMVPWWGEPLRSPSNGVQAVGRSLAPPDRYSTFQM